MALFTVQQASSCQPRLLRVARWTVETLRPSYPHEVAGTAIFRREPFIELLYGSRIINATDWM